MQIIAPKRQWFSKNQKQKKSSDAKWKRFRAHVLKIYGHQCMKCDRTDGVMQIDHIKPKSSYRSLWYEITNVQVLCQTCNLLKKRETKDYRLEWAMRNKGNPNAGYFLKRLGVATNNLFGITERKGLTKQAEGAQRAHRGR